MLRKLVKNPLQSLHRRLEVILFTLQAENSLVLRCFQSRLKFGQDANRTLKAVPNVLNSCRIMLHATEKDMGLYCQFTAESSEVDYCACGIDCF